MELQAAEIFFGYYDGDTGGQGLFRSDEFGGHGEKDDGHSDLHGAEFTGGLKTVHARHGQVQNDQVWHEKAGFFQSVKSIDSFATDVKTWLAFHEMTDSGPDEITVIDDEDMFGQGPPPPEVTALRWRAP